MSTGARARAASPAAKIPASAHSAAKVPNAASTTTSKDAMPEIDTAGFKKFVPAFVLFLTAPRAIGLAISVAIYKRGSTALYSKLIGKLAKDQQGYLYASAAIFGFLVAWLNNYPGCYKTMIMRFQSGNLRANMAIYKTQGSDDGAPYTVLETKGAVGCYNRANRSLTHFIENAIPTAICIVLAGQIFPFPTFVLTLIFALGRICHQVFYASGGYGAHGAGFAIALIASVTLEMLCLFVAIQSLGLIPTFVKNKLEL